MKDTFDIRPLVAGDEIEVSRVIRDTLLISNSNDYSRDYLEEIIKSHSPEWLTERMSDSHFYVVCTNSKIIACGGITGYWGSTTESYLTSIFVLPEYQGMGIGKRIVKTLENDQYFMRAWRTEISASVTAVDFYRKLGYEFKNGIEKIDEYGVIKLEKINR